MCGESRMGELFVVVPVRWLGEALVKGDLQAKTQREQGSEPRKPRGIPGRQPRRGTTVVKA